MTNMTERQKEYAEEMEDVREYAKVIQHYTDCSDIESFQAAVNFVHLKEIGLVLNFIDNQLRDVVEAIKFGNTLIEDEHAAKGM